MEIYLIRHTTPAIEKGICYGQADIPLVATFQEEFDAIQKQLPQKIETVYSRPLQRCVHLAKEINPVIHTDDRLKELDFGDWELQAWDDIPRAESNDWMEDFVNVAPPNGESYVELQQRVLSFYQELVAKPHKSVVIVTHAGVIRALLSYLRNIQLKDSFSIQVTYGTVFKLS